MKTRENKYKQQINKNSKKAKKALKDKDQVENIIQQAEKVLNEVPIIGNRLSDIMLMISMVKSYITGIYKEVPVGVIIAVISALIYLITPLDLIPDFIPGIGYIDDLGVFEVCWRMATIDFKKYREWRKSNEKEVV